MTRAMNVVVVVGILGTASGLPFPTAKGEPDVAVVLESVLYVHRGVVWRCLASCCRDGCFRYCS